MSYKLKVDVAQEHIDSAFLYCPVELAFVDALREAMIDVDHDDVVVDSFALNVFRFDLAIDTPKKVQKFISAYDNFKPVKPFSFTLRIQD